MLPSSHYRYRQRATVLGAYFMLDLSLITDSFCFSSSPLFGHCFSQTRYVIPRKTYPGFADVYLIDHVH